jgi:hypothetical protein
MYVGTSHPIKVCKTYEILSWTSKLEGREITKSRNLVNALVTWRRMPALAVFFLAVHICVNLSFYLYLFSLFVYPFHSISFSFFFSILGTLCFYFGRFLSFCSLFSSFFLLSPSVSLSPRSFFVHVFSLTEQTRKRLSSGGAVCLWRWTKDRLSSCLDC